MSSEASNEIIHELGLKFPLLETLRICEGESQNSEKLPPVIALFAAMTNPEIPGATCVLVPSRENVAPLVAVLSAFQAAQLHVPVLLEQYVKNSFEIGERVCVLPVGYVCRFGGYLEYGGKRYFKLLVDEKTNASRTFPLAEAVRLEKTNKKLTTKNLGKDLGEFQRSRLDFLIGTVTGGNNALMANEVVLVATIKSFKDFAEQLVFSPVDHPTLKFLLSDLVPWGIVNEDGDLEFKNSAAATGAPLIAVSPKAEYVAAYCRKNGIHAPRIIIDGAKKLNDLQALDDIVDHSKPLVIADHSELDLLPEIKNRGCKIWKLPDGLNDMVGRGNGVLHNFRDSYRASSEFVLDVISCDAPLIDDIAKSISDAAEQIQKNEPDETAQRIISTAFSKLLELSSLLHEPTDAERGEFCTKIATLTGELEARQTFIPPEAFSGLKSAFEKMVQGVQHPDFIQSKRLALIRKINEINALKTTPVIICHGNLAVNSANEFLSRERVGTIRVVTISDYFAGGAAEHVILTGWPRKSNLLKLIGNYAAANIHALSYAFERDWFANAAKKRIRQLSRYWDNSSEVFASITGLNSKLNKLTDPNTASEAQPPDTLRSNIDFEDKLLKIRKGAAAATVQPHESRRARYVGFVGPTFCYLTDGHGLPKVNDILRGNHEAGATVPIRTIADLLVGDLVLFRVSADTDKDMIRYLAEELSPRGEYERIREKADIWKAVLRSVGDTPQEISRKLREEDLSRTDQAIRSWLTSPDRIGPGQEDDLYKIARAARDRAFENRIPEIWAAISAIRGLHMNAGFKLSQLLVQELPKQVPKLSDRETTVELAFENIPLGKVAIVEIDDIADAAEDRPAWEVNRLMWDQN